MAESFIAAFPIVRIIERISLSIREMTSVAIAIVNPIVLDIIALAILPDLIDSAMSIHIPTTIRSKKCIIEIVISLVTNISGKISILKVGNARLCRIKNDDEDAH
jgi:hypothetical protein